MGKAKNLIARAWRMPLGELRDMIPRIRKRYLRSILWDIYNKRVSRRVINMEKYFSDDLPKWL